jgi:hypothetical protein
MLSCRLASFITNANNTKQIKDIMTANREAFKITRKLCITLFSTGCEELFLAIFIYIPLPFKRSSLYFMQPEFEV